MIIFKLIPNLNGRYMVSESGAVFSKFANRNLKSYINHNGYITYKLGKKNIKAHQLVAMAFLGHRPNGCTMVVDHIDNDKTNNHYSNLRIITHSQNSSCIKSPTKPSPHRNVYWDVVRDKWEVRAIVNGKNKRFGRFTFVEDAILAANAIIR